MNMVRIDGSDKSYVTQINTLKCKPEHQQELVEKMIAQAKQVMARQPGCISITLHRSTDGTQVVNYVQWQSKELLDGAHATLEFQQRLQGYRHLVLDAGPHLFEVVAQIDTGQPGK
jgi:heme-degrading monooxygenase HmoA